MACAVVVQAVHDAATMLYLPAQRKLAQVAAGCHSIDCCVLIADTHELDGRDCQCIGSIMCLV